jgi:hypothetical protein
MPWARRSCMSAPLGAVRMDRQVERIPVKPSDRSVAHGGEREKASVLTLRGIVVTMLHAT